MIERSRHFLKACALVALLLLAAGCDSGVVVHDEARARELVIDFLEALKTDEGLELAYDWTDDRYKKEVSREQFVRQMANLRMRNDRSQILLTGFEVYGPVELITLYASSEPAEGNLYLKFDLYGSKTLDYYLLKFTPADAPFEHSGVYRDYTERIEISGV